MKNISPAKPTLKPVDIDNDYVVFIPVHLKMDRKSRRLLPETMTCILTVQYEDDDVSPRPDIMLNWDNEEGRDSVTVLLDENWPDINRLIAVAQKSSRMRRDLSMITVFDVFKMAKGSRHSRNLAFHGCIWQKLQKKVVAKCTVVDDKDFKFSLSIFGLETTATTPVASLLQELDLDGKEGSDKD